MREPIRSLQNPRIKNAIRLREGRERAATGCLLIEGMAEIRQAVAGQLEFVEAFCLEAHREAPPWLEAIDHLRPEDRAGWQARFEQITTWVSPGVMEKLSFGERRSTMVVVAKTPAVALDRLVVSERSLVLIVDRVEKPGNLGAMVRTADAAGVEAVLLSDPVCDPWNANAIRASLGGIFRVPIGIGTVADIRAWLEKHGFSVLAARVDGAVDFRRATWSPRSAIVMGSEAWGLGQAWEGAGVQAIRLPMQGTVDSLNVSVTAAILLYHAAFQASRLSGG